MKNECSIVRDLLPLYAEDMVSAGTAAFVEEHLKGCESCRQECEKAKEPKPLKKNNEAAPLQNLIRKIRAKKMKTIAATVLFVMLLIASVLGKLFAPVYIPYSEGLVTLEIYGDQGVLLHFDESVTDFDYRIYDDPDDSRIGYCDIEAWTTLWDQWFARRNASPSITVVSESGPMIFSYVPNDGSENIPLAKYDPSAANPIETDVAFEHAMTLPRLALGYYLILASAALGVMIIAWFFTRKKLRVRVWIERIGLYPFSYIVSHFIVSGIQWATNSLTYDFPLTVLISVCLYGGLLLTHNIVYLRKEIKEANG